MFWYHSLVIYAQLICSTQVWFSDRWVECPTYPLAKNGRPTGMYLMQKLPNLTAIPPAPFKPGSRAVLEKTLNKETITHMLVV